MLSITPCACLLMTEVFLAVKAMQDEQMACHISSQLENMYIALLDCGVSCSLGLRAFWPETWPVLCRACISWWQKRAHQSEFNLLFSAQFLRTQQWHQVWDSSRNCAHIDGVVQSASWGYAPPVNTYSWTCNVQIKVKNWFQRRLPLRITCLDCSAVNSWPLPACLPRSHGFYVADVWMWGMQNCCAEFSCLFFLTEWPAGLSGFKLNISLSCILRTKCFGLRKLWKLQVKLRRKGKSVPLQYP